MEKKIEDMVIWNSYKKLEKDLIDLTYYIYFCDLGVSSDFYKKKEYQNENKKRDNNIGEKKIRNDMHNQLFTFSNAIADLLISCCVQYESLVRKIYFDKHTSKDKSIGKMLEGIDTMYDLQHKKVKIICKSMVFYNELGSYFAPLSYTTKDNNDFYSAFCSIKHNRINSLNKANINILIRAMASLYLLNIYNKFESEKIQYIHNFDDTLGSDIFSIKYYVSDCIKENQEAAIIIEKNCDYKKELEEFIKQVSEQYDNDIDIGESYQEPRKYRVLLNMPKQE